MRDSGQCLKLGAGGNGEYEELLYSRVLLPADFGTGNHWSRFVSPFGLTNPLNALDVRVEWHANASLDVAGLTLTLCSALGDEVKI